MSNRVMPSGTFLACIFCKGPTVRPELERATGRWWMSCYACCSVGPRKDTEQEAIDAWKKMTAEKLGIIIDLPKGAYIRVDVGPQNDDGRTIRLETAEADFAGILDLSVENTKKVIAALQEHVETEPTVPTQVMVTAVKEGIAVRNPEPELEPFACARCGVMVPYATPEGKPGPVCPGCGQQFYSAPRDGMPKHDY